MNQCNRTRLAKAISDGQHCINLLIFILFMYVRLIISANKVVVVVVVVPKFT